VSVTRTVVPGDWYGVLGDNVIVLLPPAAKPRVAGLWETIDEGAGFDEVLDALISRGLRELPGFVLVAGEGRDVKVVIRGAGEAALTTEDGEVVVSGSADTTWVERNVAGVTALRVRVADGDGPAYAVGAGLVRVASVEHPATAGALPMPDAEAVAVPVETRAPQPPAPEPSRPILPPDPQLETPEPPPAPAADEADVDQGRPVARLVFSSGNVVDLDRPVVVGRAPDHGRLAAHEGARLVTVPSPHHEISSTHLEIRPGEGPDEGSAMVTDLGSTNGTVVVQPGRPAHDLQPGVSVRLEPGATIDLGEGVTISVEGD
jgi:hypothetical protein